MSSDIFISYAREDRGRVQPIAEALAARGYGVWWDKGLRSGEDYRDRIEEMLKTARCVIVAWSRHSVQSDFVLDEAGRGHRRKVLLPVFIDPGIDPPLGFGGIHTSDLSDWKGDPSDPAFEQFVGDVAAVLGREPSPAPLPSPTPVPDGRPRRGLRPLAIGGGALGFAMLVAYLSSRAMSSAGSDVTPNGMDTAGVVAVEDSATAALASTPAARPCSVADAGGNPLEARRQGRAGLPFSVDTATHLLLDARGQPVGGGAASSYGTLRDRLFIVAHSSFIPDGAAETYFQQPGVNSSTHVMIARDGTVRQMLPFDFAARHAGQSKWRGVENLNSHSIGIDMENLGRLSRRRDREWTGSGHPVPEDSVDLIPADSGAVQGWHRYTTAQIRAFVQVSCALRRAYPTLRDVVGHDSIAPGRKLDPGPAFPIDNVRTRVFPPR